MEALIKKIQAELCTKHDFFCLLWYLYHYTEVLEKDVRELMEGKKNFDERDESTVIDHRQATQYAKLGYFKQGDYKYLPASVRLNIPLIFRYFSLSAEEWFSYDKVYNFPQPNVQFIGRKAELSSIHGLLSKKHKRVAIIGVSLNAIGGQGKTSLSLEYAHQYQSEYSCIFWIDFNQGSPAKQLEEFCIKSCKIAEYDKRLANKQETKLNYYWRLLSYRFRKKCLLILDDVPHDANVAKFLPQTTDTNIHFLLTSRKKILKIKAEPMRLTPLNAEDAGLLFIERSGQTLLNAQDQQLQLLVTELLGGHALSIALIASYAKTHQIKDLSVLCEKINQYGANQVSGDYLIDEYPHSLRAAFDLSFNAVSKQSQLLLLLFSLFPRIPIPHRVYKQCIKHIRTEQPELKIVVSEFNHNDQKPASLNELLNLCLIEQRSSQQNYYFILHEVIYDFVRNQWKLTSENSLELLQIESEFINSSIIFAKNMVDDHRVSHAKSSQTKPKDLTAELRAISGLLTPLVDERRQLFPTTERLNLCLNFWFENYRFHQFVYDSEIQDFLLPNLESIKNYLLKKDQYTGLNQFIIAKLLGHAYYAMPKEKGEEAVELFKQAILVGQELKKKNRAIDQNVVDTIKWYEIFLIDHLVNVASKNRYKNKETIPLDQDPDFTNELSLLESELPDSLMDVDTPIELKDYRLLLRAAHYWGHRGNQDSYTLLRQVVTRLFNHETPILLKQAKAHYIRAVNYRLAALRLFFPKTYDNDLSISMGKLPYISDWIDNLVIPSPKLYMEDFTHYFQGVGDTAHQYRGINFIDALEICYLLLIKSNNPSLDNLNNSYRAADKLWRYASYSSEKQRILRTEPPIKYVLWMCSSKVIMELLSIYINQHQLTPWKNIQETIVNEVKVMSKELKVSYQFGAEEQIKQIEDIWKVLESL
ncbi:NB-ARC domain-containing protein [Aliikangiella sp. IMCC44359]|uniref:NB-ARC domain-containing protein n=1 Tax=Aliikangiella sp. IMCC44359 TaxID=3459125 RepID=UPI00403B3315